MSIELENRKPIWKAISEFYLDTKLQEYDYVSLAATFKKSNKSIDELERIDLFEVFPVCKINWITPSPIGALDEFKTDWLNENCTKNYLKRNSLIFRLKTKIQALFIGNNNEHWKEIKHIMNTPTKMELHKTPYNNQLKKLQFADFQFTNISLNNLPIPYYKDYSHETDPAYKDYKYWDKMGFKNELLNNLNDIIKDEILRIKIITPKETHLPYTVFAFLKSKYIVGLHIENKGNFKSWMKLFFERQYKKRKEDIEDGLYLRQPELDRNAPFMLSFDNKGGFGLCSIHTGMKFDEKPFDNTGAYLHKVAPKQYNEAKIVKEKQNYIKKYINTNGANFDVSLLEKQFSEFLDTKGLQHNPAQNNEQVYQEFEKLAGYVFPKELKTLFAIHSGIEKIGFLTAQQVLTEWKNWKVIYDDVNWMLIDLTGNNHPDGRKTIGMYTNPYWIPFLSTGGGNFIAIDYAPGSKGESGQIIAFGADEIKIRFIAKNMLDFLQQFIDGKDVLNNGFDE